MQFYIDFMEFRIKTWTMSYHGTIFFLSLSLFSLLLISFLGNKVSPYIVVWRYSLV